MASAVADQISKLEAARQLVLGDATHYSVIIPGILPIIGARAQVEIRRWGAEFLSEAFANPLLQSSSKETLGVQVLQTLRELLEVQAEDEVVVKGVIQTAASIYPPVFRYM
jgi:symplekin